MLLQADAYKTPFPDQSFHCCVTSPPYWGLRKYAGDQGDEPLGLEKTPEQHIDRIVEIMAEVRRVLRDDGVLWLNYGDCYASGTQFNVQRGLEKADRYTESKEGEWAGHRSQPADIAQGNLMLMPHRVALALQADGWIVRQDLVWYKRNPMPESVAGWRWQRERRTIRSQKPASGAGLYAEGSGNPRARPGSGGVTGKMPEEYQTEYEYGDDLELRRSSWRHTRAHEYVFMLTKKMGYWSNQEAVREKTIPDPRDKQWGQTERTTFHDHSDDDGKGMSQPKTQSEGFVRMSNPSGRNPRSVLDIPTAPYKGAHYATFPPNLIAPLIRATCPRWACPVCGQGWAAVVEKDAAYEGDTGGFGDHGSKWKTQDEQSSGHRIQRNLNVMRAQGRDHDNPFPKSSVSGYRPTCDHPHTQDEAVPGIVFDPFVGSGTTVMVAQQLLRRGIGMDISRPYLDGQAKLRTKSGMPRGALEDLPLFNNAMMRS